MEYEVAVTPSSSAHEMVRDVVVEEMTYTVSPSGEENIVCQREPHRLTCCFNSNRPNWSRISTVDCLQCNNVCSGWSQSRDSGFSSTTIIDIHSSDQCSTDSRLYYVASYHSITVQTSQLIPLNCDTSGCDSAFSRHWRISRS